MANEIVYSYGTQKTSSNSPEFMLNTESCKKQIQTERPLQYLSEHGFKQEFIEKSELGYNAQIDALILSNKGYRNKTVMPSLIFSEPDSEICLFIGKDVELFFKQMQRAKESEVNLYNVKALEKPVLAIAGSVLDTLTLESLGLPTVGLLKVKAIAELIKLIRETKPVDKCHKERIIFLAFSQDELGRRLSAEILTAFDKADIFVKDISVLVCGKFFSVNDRLRVKAEDLKNIIDFQIKDSDYLLDLEKDIRGFEDQRRKERKEKWFQQTLFEREDTDLDNAFRILHTYGDDIRYCVDTKTWLTYKTSRWDFKGTSNSALYSFTNELAGVMLKKAVDKKEYKRAMSLRSKRKASDAIEMIKGCKEYLVTAEDLNREDFLLNCKNGVVDLTTGKIHDHDRRLLFTQITDAEYEPGYSSQVFKDFLEQILPDEETREALLYFLGYCLTGSVREEKALFIHGVGGNGKGSLIKVLEKVFGSFCTPFKIEAILAGKYEKDGDAPNPELSKLQYRRLAIAEEIPEGRILDAAKFKLLTGGDSLPIRKLYSEPTVIKNPTYKMIFSGNHLPKLNNANDEGLRRRLMIIPFTQDFTGERRDTRLKERLSTAEVSCGCLSLLVEYCMKWQKEGLKVSGLMQQAFDQYMDGAKKKSSTMLTLYSYLQTHVAYGVGLKITRADLIRQVRSQEISDIQRLKDEDIVEVVLSYAAGKGVVYGRSNDNGSYALRGMTLI